MFLCDTSTFFSLCCSRCPADRLQSTKMEALMEEVHLMMERDPAAKAIVFSQARRVLSHAASGGGL